MVNEMHQLSHCLLSFFKLIGFFLRSIFVILKKRHDKV
jgi:hypothetical protein